jgi:hypothetical protein
VIPSLTLFLENSEVPMRRLKEIKYPSSIHIILLLQTETTNIYYSIFLPAMVYPEINGLGHLNAGCLQA